MPDDDTPVLDTLADITAASVEHNSLPPRELMMARLAALIAVDAPPASYLANAGAAADSGVTADDMQGIMIAVAPVVGTARVVSAGGKILRALGFAIVVADEMADDDASSSSNHARPVPGTYPSAPLTRAVCTRPVSCGDLDLLLTIWGHGGR